MRPTPPPQLFEDTVDRAEERLGLTGQPRAIVFHTKNGRRHAHAVWCRVEPEEMKAVPLPYTKRKMQELSREIYRERNWTMPRGFERTEFRDPRNYSLAEWQQAKRAEIDPAKLKMMFQDTWAMSDSKSAFENALRERGYHLARGDRRGHVAVDFKGEVYPISRWTGIKAKDVRTRLGGIEDLRSVDQARQDAKDVVAARLVELQREQDKQERIKAERIERERQAKIAAQKKRRAQILQEQRERQQKELEERNARIRKGLVGLLDRITGKRKKTIAENTQDQQRALQRDQIERQSVALAQKQSREQTAVKDRMMREEFMKVRQELAQDTENLRQQNQEKMDRETFMRTRQEAAERLQRTRNRDGPDLSR